MKNLSTLLLSAALLVGANLAMETSVFACIPAGDIGCKDSGGESCCPGSQCQAGHCMTATPPR